MTDEEILASLNTNIRRLVTGRDRERMQGTLRRMDVTHNVVELCRALLAEGYESDDIVDALLRAACWRIGNKPEYLHWRRMWLARNRSGR
jgi:hypothetical protein